MMIGASDDKAPSGHSGGLWVFVAMMASLHVIRQDLSLLMRSMSPHAGSDTLGLATMLFLALGFALLGRDLHRDAERRGHLDNRRPVRGVPERGGSDCHHPHDAIVAGHRIWRRSWRALLVLLLRPPQ